MYIAFYGNMIFGDINNIHFNVKLLQR